MLSRFKKPGNQERSALYFPEKYVIVYYPAVGERGTIAGALILKNGLAAVPAIINHSGDMYIFTWLGAAKAARK